MTLEHIRPISRSGNNKLSNLVLACRDCNEERGDELLTFVDIVAAERPVPTALEEQLRTWMETVA
jgi:5-methylcytosine-specific restriction endonuclease McrA